MAQLKEGSTVGGQEIAVLAHLMGESTINGNLIATKPDVDDAKDLIGRAIADIDNSVEVPTDPSFNDLANAISEINTTPDLVAGDIEVYSDNKSYLMETSSYQKQKEARVLMDGTIRVRFDLSRQNESTSNPRTAYARIYINDVPVGIERENSTESTLYFEEDFSVNSGDLIQLFMRQSESGWGFARTEHFSLRIGIPYENEDVVISVTEDRRSW